MVYEVGTFSSSWEDSSEEGEKEKEDARGKRRHGSVSPIWGSDYEGPIYKVNPLLVCDDQKSMKVKEK